MKVSLPYGKEIVSFDVPDKAFIGMSDPPYSAPHADPLGAIRHAIENPIGSPKLEEIIKPGQTIALIVDDISRPTPINTILPIILEKLETIGVIDDDITIIVALGSHRYMTVEEIKERVGEDVYARYKVINSEFKDESRLVYIGDTPDGAELYATKEVVDSDIKIGIGNLAPHPVMGWGGGGKILYPGIAGEDTVAYFHLKASLYDENFFGMDTTPIREMMESWVDAIGLDFVINTILTGELKIAEVVSGNYVKAHQAGVKIGKKIMGCKIEEKADVVVVSSHPADQDFWQSPKAMYGAEEILKGKRGGTMILVSPNYEGIGPHAEYPEFMGRDDGDETVLACIKKEKTDGDPLAIAVGNGMSKMRNRRKLVVVSDGVTAEEMAACGCIHYPVSRLQEAVDEAINEYDDCRLSAISNGAEIFLYN